MKILATSDIHQMISKWKDLVKVCQSEKFDVVCIAGDLFPKDQSITGQLSYFQHIQRYAGKIKDTGAVIVLMLGNDDNQLLIPPMKQADVDGLWHYVADKIVDINGLTFVGMPYVPDYPFGYKFWCRGEYKDNLRIDPIQLGKPLLINNNNQIKYIDDYPAYLNHSPCIWDVLTDTAKKVTDMAKSIWLIHAPPAGMNLDVCARGVKVGSGAVTKFIQDYQPLITIHGHIHESAEYNGHMWHAVEGKTICIQGGQVGFDLHYTTIDVEEKTISLQHSLYKPKVTYGRKQ